MRALSNVLTACAVLTLAFAAQSCGFWDSPGGDSENGSAVPQKASNIPFLTKEPDRFQANITVTAFGEDGEALVREYVIAKRGTDVAVVIGPGTDKELRLIEHSDKKFILNMRERSIRERAGGPSGDDLAEQLTRGWMTVTPGTKYEKLGTENGITRFRVSPENLEASEIFVLYDENLKFPVGSEIYSVREGARDLTFKYEVSEWKDTPDDNLFTVPEGFTEQPDNAN